MSLNPKHFALFVFLALAILSASASGVQAATCQSQGGTCRPICDLGETRPAIADNCSGDNGECCIDNDAPVITPTPNPTPAGKVCKETGGNDQGTCQGACELSSTYHVNSADCTEAGASECCVSVEYTTPGEKTGDTTNPNAGGLCGGGHCVKNDKNECPTGEKDYGKCAGSGGICCAKPPATSGGGQQATINFTNPLAFNTVEEVLTKLLTTLQAIIVTLALVFLVIGAILYIISAGNEQRMETGKKAIMAAMIGLAIGLAAPSFLKEIGEVLGWGPVDNAAVAGAKTLTEIALNVLHFLLSIVGVLAIIMLVIGGLAYLTAAGNEERIESGKKIVTYSIIGIIIAFGALVIVTQIGNFFTS